MGALEKKTGTEFHGKNILKALIYQHFDTIGEFCEAMGWNRNRLYRLYKNKDGPTLAECQQMADVFDMNLSDFMGILLSEKSPNA
ncbi:MAG: helix-turn-helix transcriptional regulator [Lachnospiraceae bacterium]|nr:helix-turn-helix transcriptional regulator [Lachnospiraceae bacterium]